MISRKRKKNLSQFNGFPQRRLHKSFFEKEHLKTQGKGSFISSFFFGHLGLGYHTMHDTNPKLYC
jgi:hypothetical protein